MIESLACPKCYADGYRALGAHAAGVRVACALCGTLYVLPSRDRLIERANRHRENADRYWALDEPSYHSPKPASSLRCNPVPPSSLWARLRNAWHSAVAGWRGCCQSPQAKGPVMPPRTRVADLAITVDAEPGAPILVELHTQLAAPNDRLQVLTKSTSFSDAETIEKELRNLLVLALSDALRRALDATRRK